MSTDDERPCRRLLVLEPEVEGHPREWLLHLIRFAATGRGSYVVWFVVAPELCGELAAAVPGELRERIRLQPLGSFERRLCSNRLLVVSAFARWWVMRRYLRRTGAEAGHFLSLDLLSLPLALGFGAAGRRLCGILFRPSVHYRDLGPYRPGVNERFRDLRKAVLYRLMLINRAVGVVLTLDPYFTTHAARRYARGFKVRALPDPAHPSANSAPKDAALAARFPSGRVCFLLFGHLTRRKGVLTLLAALDLLSPSTASRVAVMLAGRLEAVVREPVAACGRSFATRRNGLWLHVEDRRIGVGELDALVGRSDVVLAPYLRFVGSSGVLLWAARTGRPLLTQDYGLIGRLVRDHGLGLTLDTTDPRAIARGIDRMVEQGPESFIDRTTARRFIDGRTPDGFAAGVFASLLES